MTGSRMTNQKDAVMIKAKVGNTMEKTGNDSGDRTQGAVCGWCLVHQFRCRLKHMSSRTTAPASKHDIHGWGEPGREIWGTPLLGHTSLWGAQ